MTFTQASFAQHQPDMVVAIKPTKSQNKRTTVCIPETVPTVANRQTPKNMLHASTYSLVLILLLSIVMVFLLIQAFAGIQDLNNEISAMQQQLDAASLEEAAQKAALQQKYQQAGSIESFAQGQGMIPSSGAVSVVLPE